MAAEQAPTRKKRRRKRSPRAVAAELAIENRREKATKLKVAGWSYRDIGAHLRCSIGTVHSDIAAVLERTRDKADGRIERERALSVARLDVATKAIWADVEGGDLEAVDRLVRLEARRAKYEGTDAPDGLELSGPGGAPITIDARTALLNRLASLIDREAPAGSAGEDPRKPDGG